MFDMRILKYCVLLVSYFVTNGSTASTSDTSGNVVTFTEADAALEFDTFDGDQDVELRFQFKTTDSDGVMVHGCGVTENDFIQITLMGGEAIQFRYNFKNNMKLLEYMHNATLSNDNWQTVHVGLNQEQIWMIVNEVVLNETVSDVTSFRLRTLIIGSSVDYSRGYVGCMKELRVNDKLVDMHGAARDGRFTYGVKQGCVKTTKCSSNPCFNGGQCLEGYSHYKCDCTATPYGGTVCSKEVGMTLQSGAYIKFLDVQDLFETGVHNITVGFDTLMKQGIILQMKDEKNMESLSITMNNYGGVKFVSDAGFERYEVNTYNEGVDLSDGQPHVLVVRIDTSRIFMQVDSYDSTTASLSGHWTQIGPENPKYMYIGNNDTDSGFNRFNGCIYRMQIDGFYPLKAALQDPRPNAVTFVRESMMHEDTCGLDEMIHRPEPLELRPYKPQCGNLTFTDLGPGISNESSLLTISKDNYTLDSNAARTLTVTCSFNATNAKLLYYIVIRRETSPGSGELECVATLEAQSTANATIHYKTTNDEDFTASGSLDTSATSYPFLRLEMDREKLTSSDIRNYTCEAAYKYSTKDALAITRSVGAITDDMLDNVVTFTQADATLEFDSFKGSELREIQFAFKTTESDGVMIHGAGDLDNDFMQIRLTNADKIEMTYLLDNSMVEWKYQDRSILNDDNWHVVHMKLVNYEALLSVDNSLAVRRTITFNERFGKITLAKALIVGAAADYSSGFIGCLRDLVINGTFVDMRGAVRNNKFIYGIQEGCFKTKMCSSNPCFNGGQCLEGYSHYKCDCTATPYGGTVCSKEVGVSLMVNYFVRIGDAQSPPSRPLFQNISVGFITKKKQGILFQYQDENNNEKVSFLMNNAGGVKFLLDVGFEAWEFNSDQRIDLTNGEAHEVFVWRKQLKDIYMQVDSYEPVHDRLHLAISDVIFDKPAKLFIGNNDTENFSNGFEGCIYRMQIDNFYPLKMAFQEPRPTSVKLFPEAMVHEASCGFEEIKHDEPIELRPFEPTCGTMTRYDLGLDHQESQEALSNGTLFTFSRNNFLLEGETNGTLTMSCNVNTTNAQLVYYILFRRETTPDSDIFECLAMVQAGATNPAALYDNITNDRNFIVTGKIDPTETSGAYLEMQMDVEKLMKTDARDYMCEVAYKYSTLGALKILRTTEKLLLLSDDDKKDSDDGKKDKSRTGLIVGVTVGVVTVIIVVTVTACYCVARRRKQNDFSVRYRPTS